MKINKLNFKNINSLKGEHCIEFNKPPLSETGIFAITGAVGSGKSTILDVITLALFNKTPRFSSLSTNEISYHGAIITRNTKECYAEIEYQVKENVYRSRWSVSINKNDNFRDYEMEITHLNENKILDVKKSQVPAKNAELIGLNYDQFVKSILLSQGEFSKFLKANESERSELLEKITGTDIYRKIGVACYQRTKDEKTKLDALNQKAQLIETLSYEEIENINNQQEQLKQTNNAIKQSEKQLNQLLAIKKNLGIFLNEKQELEKKLQSNQTQKEAFKAKRIVLENHEKLVIFQNQFNDLKHIENQLVTQTNELSVLHKNKLKLEEKKNTESQKFEATQKDLANKTLELSKLEPICEKVENLDNEMLIQEARIKELNTQNAEIIKSIEQKTHEIKTLTQSIEKFNIEKTKIEKFIAENSDFQELSKELSSLKQASHHYIELKKEFLSIKNKTIENSIIKNKFDAENIYNFIKTEFDKISDDIANLRKQTTLSPNEAAKIRTQIENLREKYKAIEQLRKSVNQMQLIEKELNELDDKIQSEKNEIPKLNNKEADLKAKLQIIQTHIEELKIRQQRQLLEKNYEKDRKKLEENQACPLCGSVHHPFVQNYENELDSTQKLLQKQENLLTTTQKEITETEKEILKRNLLIESTTKNLNEKTVFQNEENQIVEKIKNTYKLSITSLNEIENQMNLIKNEGLELAKNLKILENLRETEKQKSELELLFEKIKNIFKYQQTIQEFSSKYARILSKNGIIENIYNELETFSIKFEKEKARFNQLQNTIHENDNILKIKIIDLESNETKKAELNAKLSETTTQFTGIQAQRIELFGNKNPKMELKNKTIEIKNLSEKQQIIQNELTKTETELKSTQSTINTTNQKVNQNNEQKQQQEIELLEKIKTIGFQDIKLAEKAILSEKELTELKLTEKKLDNDYIAINQSLTDKTQNIEELKQQDDTSISLIELEQKVTENTNIFNQNTKELGIISNKLANDAMNKKTVAEILQTIEKQQKETIKWENLNRIIGDAKGKIFTDYAQKLSLKQLFFLANKHLKVLDQRYLIDTQNSAKDIFVLDGYQGNAMRSVKTLSGGESFLVSLALALGLSDMAGRDTQIGSLFIDEGFGSLDQQALDTALSALEKLQSESNKTIGIISHVSSLKERIQTQIELKKSNSAFSELIIHS